MSVLRHSAGEKGQISVEFMFIFIIFMAVLAVAIISVMQNLQSVYSSRLGLEAEQTLSLVKAKLDTAFLEGPGFLTNLSLPQKILELDYSVNISGGFAVLEVSNQTYSKFLLSRNITGSLRKGENSVRNIGMGIVIS